MACLLACLLWSCGKKKADDPMGDNGRTQRTENLLYHLKEISSKGYLFGQQDATLYGEGWADDSARSDIKTICGDMPSLVGFEIGVLKLEIHSTSTLPHSTSSAKKSSTNTIVLALLPYHGSAKILLEEVLSTTSWKAAANTKPFWDGLTK